MKWSFESPPEQSKVLFSWQYLHIVGFKHFIMLSERTNYNIDFTAGTSKTVVVRVTSLHMDGLITLLWPRRITFLLICTRLHEFELVPYIIINLLRKLRSPSCICSNDGTEWSRWAWVHSGLPDGNLSITRASHPNSGRPIHEIIGSALPWPVLQSGPRGRALPARVRDPRGVAARVFY